jgi:hypothetical protein
MASDGLEGMIAERRLTLVCDDGQARDVVVRVAKPERSPDREEFSYECEILGLDEGNVRRIYGLDAFQALQLVLSFISTLLNHYRREAKGRIYWLEPGDDMGFAEVEGRTKP